MSIQNFSHDLFHSHILPDLLSEYIHELLVNANPPEWNPFRTLPLVSSYFYLSCRTLCSSIFSPVDYEEMASSGITDLLDGAQELWERANLPPTRALPVDYSTREELKSSDSLVQVYICAATAKSYLSLDVLWHLELERKRLAGELDDADDENMDLSPDGLPPARRFKMRDDNMHRVFLPLTCAIELCDQVRPARLAYIVADYLASIIPRYATAPLLLKCTQDLETYVSGEHSQSDGKLCAINQTLCLVDGTSQLLYDVQENVGNLVKSFKRSSSIPLRVLRETNILDVLDKIAAANWGEGSGWINDYTRSVIIRLLSAAA